MRFISHWMLIGLICLPAQTPSLAGETEEGFVSIFNGKDLSGWVGNVTGYKADNGSLVCDPTTGSGNLMTEKEYTDFIFRFEFKLTPGANNGLGIRAPLGGDAAYKGYELQILDNTSEQYADLKPYQYHGSLYGLAAAKRGFLKPVGEWNEQEVTVDGETIKVVLNGTEILNVNLDKIRSKPTLDGREHPGLERKTGHIGFLGHGDPIEFRNLRLKNLGK